MSVLRDHYYKLGSELPEERIGAASALLSELVKVDSKEEYDYALGRLITGLTTSRQSARFGFSMALTELIRELILKESYDLTVQTYLDKLVAATKVSSSMKGKELRSVLFGRLFGLQALVNSEILFNDDVSDVELLTLFVRLIVELSATKSWLRETAMFTLCQFLNLYLKSSFYNEEFLVTLLQSISDEGLAFTVEGLAVTLTLPQAVRAKVASQVNATSHWKNFDPMTRGNLPTLAKVLKDVDAVEESDETEGKQKKNSKQKGTWSPRIPFVWELLVAHFQGADLEEEPVETAVSSKKRKKSQPATPKKKAKTEAVETLLLKEFWKVTVDETLFSEKSSAERKYWGLEIFNLFLEKLPALSIEDLFTPNLMRCLINHSAKSDRLLNKLSTKTLNLFIQISQKDLSKVSPMLNSILDKKKGGCWNFDSLTKSKVADSLIGVLSYVGNVDEISDSQVDQLVLTIEETLIALFNTALSEQEEPKASEEVVHKKSNDNVLKWVSDKQLLLFRSTKRFKANKTKLLDNIFKFLIRHSFFKEKNGPQVSNNVLKLIQDKLNSFLSEVISQRRKDHSWSLYCVKQIEKFEKDDTLEPILELDDDLLAIKNDTLEMLDTIKDAMKRDSSRKEQHYCFELLFSMVLIQLYMGEAETVGILEEVKTCYAEAFSSANEDVETSVILTEIILSFVSKKSTLLKKLCTIVWESFLCTKNEDGRINLNEQCFQLLFDVLKTKENEEGQKALFEGEDEYGVEGEDDEEEDEEEENDKKEKEGSSGESEDEEESEQEDDEESGEELDSTAKVDKETTIKLAKALGIPTETSGEVKFDEIDSFGEDDDEYESESADDEQMMAMDDELSRIFKERHDALSANNTNKKKADTVRAKEQILLFKNRVLDLLESFAKVQPNSVHNIACIRPIVNLINTTTDKNLGVKAHKLLKARISRVKVSNNELKQMMPTAEEQEAYATKLLELIEWLQKQAGTYSSNQAHSLACSQSCIIVSKTLLAVDSSKLPAIIAIYTGALTLWATDSKNRIQASMFFDFINWLSAKRSNNTD